MKSFTLNASKLNAYESTRCVLEIKQSFDREQHWPTNHW